MQEKIECLELEKWQLKQQNKDLFCLSETAIYWHISLSKKLGERGPFYKKVCDLCSAVSIGLVFCLKYLQNQTEKSLSLSALEIDEASLELLELNYRQNFKNISKTILKGDLRKTMSRGLKSFRVTRVKPS